MTKKTKHKLVDMGKIARDFDSIRVLKDIWLKLVGKADLQLRKEASQVWHAADGGALAKACESALNWLDWMKEELLQGDFADYDTRSGETRRLEDILTVVKAPFIIPYTGCTFPDMDVDDPEEFFFSYAGVRVPDYDPETELKPLLDAAELPRELVALMLTSPDMHNACYFRVNIAADCEKVHTHLAAFLRMCAARARDLGDLALAEQFVEAEVLRTRIQRQWLFLKDAADEADFERLVTEGFRRLKALLRLQTWPSWQAYLPKKGAK